MMSLKKEAVQMPQQPPVSGCYTSRVILKKIIVGCKVWVSDFTDTLCFPLLLHLHTIQTWNSIHTALLSK